MCVSWITSDNLWPRLRKIISDDIVLDECLKELETWFTNRGNISEIKTYNKIDLYQMRCEMATENHFFKGDSEILCRLLINSDFHETQKTTKTNQTVEKEISNTICNYTITTVITTSSTSFRLIILISKCARYYTVCQNFGRFRKGPKILKQPQTRRQH